MFLASSREDLGRLHVHGAVGDARGGVAHAELRVLLAGHGHAGARNVDVHPGSLSARVGLQRPHRLLRMPGQGNEEGKKKENL